MSSLTPLIRPEIPDGTLPWPPAYTVRVSSRAKHPRLRVLPGAGLEVVLPRTMSPNTAPELVDRHRDWIAKTLEKVCGGEENAVPCSVALHGGADTRHVVCAGEAFAGENSVLLRARRDDVAAALRELRLWTREHAGRVLMRQTATLAGECGLTYTDLRVRRQKSRWGSCSAKGCLSLNTCLVFLPPALARHVILHELAHTRHMNHGQEFWKLLFSMEPEALKLDRRLRSAWKFVPSWIWG